MEFRLGHYQAWALQMLLAPTILLMLSVPAFAQSSLGLSGLHSDHSPQDTLGILRSRGARAIQVSDTALEINSLRVADTNIPVTANLFFRPTSQGPRLYLVQFRAAGTQGFRQYLDWINWLDSTYTIVEQQIKDTHVNIMYCYDKLTVATVSLDNDGVVLLFLYDERNKVCASSTLRARKSPVDYLFREDGALAKQVRTQNHLADAQSRATPTPPSGSERNTPASRPQGSLPMPSSIASPSGRSPQYQQLLRCVGVAEAIKGIATGLKRTAEIKQAESDFARLFGQWSAVGAGEGLDQLALARDYGLNRQATLRPYMMLDADGGRGTFFEIDVHYCKAAGHLR